MGMMHISGKGAEQSDSQALEWFLRAARKGHADSQHNAAVIYERTEGSLKDPAEARRWYRAAAQQGLARSQAKLGALLLDGIGGRREPRRGQGMAGEGGGAGRALRPVSPRDALPRGARLRAQRRHRARS